MPIDSMVAPRSAVVGEKAALSSTLVLMRDPPGIGRGRQFVPLKFRKGRKRYAGVTSRCVFGLDRRYRRSDEAPMDADAIVIGAGQAAVPLAVRLAKSGKRTLLVERSRLGGTCVNYGCTPTKTMVASARAAHVARTSGRLGVECGSPRVDFKAIIARKEAVVRSWREGLRARLDGAGDRLRVVNGHARFTGEREIEVGGERHRAAIFVIDVGVRPATPDVDGLAALPWLDNRRVMELDALPEHLVVIGGGYIGCEFAQMFRRFGSAVTVVQRGPHLLDREDPDVSEVLEGVFRSEGIEVILDASVRRAGAGRSRVAIVLQ